MAKAKPNQAQLEFIEKNCETHDKTSLAEATGLDVDLCDDLRNQALTKSHRAQARKLGKLTDGVFAMTPQLHGRVGDDYGGSKMGEPTPEQVRQLAAKRAEYTAKAYPD